MFEIQRLPHEAELNLSNAIASINEARMVIRQYRPEYGVWCNAWDVLLKNLQKAEAACVKARKQVTEGEAFAALREVVK